LTAARVVAPEPVSAAREDRTKGFKHGMTQQDVLRTFGSPHGQERILDSVYWYYADDELKGQYVRFDATTRSVNG
jgi:outer membrane protein assembly factor BamE (lipoprotein component of BamABCDE complex)